MNKYKKPNFIIRKFLGFFGGKQKNLGEIKLENMNPVKRTFFIAWSNRKNLSELLLIFIIVVVLAFAFSKRETVSVTLSLNYEEASKGQNPNKTRYNVYEFKSAEVMKRAIEYAGIEDIITPEELAENIDIIEHNASKIDPQDTNSYYISTSYNVRYSHDRAIKDVSAHDMMSLICKAYNEYFHDCYVGNKSVLKYQLGDVSDKEYIEIGKLFSEKSDEMLRYINQRISANATFVSETTGESFQTVRKMLQNVQNYSIKKYSSFVLESGITRNTDHYMRTLTYSNEVMDIRWRKFMIDYNVRKQGVTDYDAGMIGTVMVPSINSRKQYYMSRTNTGTDYMTLDADYFLNQGSLVERSIIDNNNIMDKISGSEPSSEDYEKVNQLIEQVDSELRTVANIANITDRDYLKYTTKDYLSFDVADNKAFNLILFQDVLTACVLFMFVLCILGYMADSYIRNRGVLNSEEL